MRIVGGRHRGRRLTAPGGRAVRPTADRVREAAFNLLAHGTAAVDLRGAAVVDVFAGSGALGLEALSRGAARATFIDSDRNAIAAIRRNAAALGEADKVALFCLDASRLPPPPGVAEAPVRLAFLDPPYGSDLAIPALAGLVDKGWIVQGSVAVVEIGAREPFEPPPAFRVLDQRTYGAARVVFVVLGEELS
ncbi:MAG: 16S rRNA (guanine(966)-N(2))-methyltransferase RsmD [Rhodospirillales bacterium]|jgi:16S rRNA (guanine966-N2)-methyltransferase|nr:16S rRNA (guanine(966)-N(2))-methyltransferase RsmD [Rhodospirillales bacterium]